MKKILFLAAFINSLIFGNNPVEIDPITKEIQYPATATVSCLPVMRPSGSNHAAGLCPDPGAGAGTTKFLREDSTWQVPPAGGSTPTGTGWRHVTAGVEDAASSTPTKSDVGLGSVENTALSTWAGSTNIITLGTIGTGTWSATAVGTSKGGTGATSVIGGKDALTTKGADIASAGTTDLNTATGEYVDITGTVTITALGTVAAGAERILRFTGILTFTHNASSLILPGAANITTAAGDVAFMRSLGSGNWKCTAFIRGAAAPISGTNTGDNAANSSTMFIGTTSHALNRASASEALTGITSIDGTATGGTAAAAVTNAMHANYGALSVSGRSANSAGVPADIAATAASGAVLRESGSTIGFGTIATAGIANNAVDNTKQSQLAANTIKANNTGSTANAIDATAVQVKTMLNVVNDAIVSASAGINTTETVIVKNTAMAASRLAAKTVLRIIWNGTCTSTAANVSTFAVRIGTNGSTADGLMASAATGAAQTSGTTINFTAEMLLTIRTTGSSATCHGTFMLWNSGTTGIATVVSQTILPTFTTFNTTTANNIISATYKSAASTTTSTFQNAFIEFVNL